MSQAAPSPKQGTIGWIDLTVPDADRVRDFYAQVVGWAPGGVDMGGYEDYTMTPPGGGGPVAGVCHARGVNAGLPPCWMIYIHVEDLHASLARAEALGGKRIGDVKGNPGHGLTCVVQDPSGAVFTLHQAGA